MPLPYATHIGSFMEDKPGLQQWSRKVPGTWFSPITLAQTLGQLVRHARALTERFHNPTSVQFRCEWQGLKGRQVFDINAGIPWRDTLVARDNRRIATFECTPAELVSRARIVSELGGPVMRAFDPEFNFSPDWVAQRLANRDG
jgi:hypothetical protein